MPTMRRNLDMIPLFSLCIVLSGCATGPLYGDNATGIVQLNPLMARLAIFRESHFLDSLDPTRIEVDGNPIGNLHNKSVFFFDHNPGDVVISADSPTMFGWYKIQVNLKPGTTYYLEVSPNTDVNSSLALGGLVGYAAYSSNETKDKSGEWQILLVTESEAVPKLGKLHDETVWHTGSSQTTDSPNKPPE